MVEAIFVEDCAPPGTQGRLFASLTDGPHRFHVVSLVGEVHLSTRVLGVALTAAKHLASVEGEAWITTDDGTSARLRGSTVGSATPYQPWIRTVACALQREEPTP